MDEIFFYKNVFSSQGWRALVVFENGLSAAPTHVWMPADRVEDFIESARAYDEEKINVYHTCASFKTNRNRKRENAGYCRSLWLDIDVGENKPYTTVEQAMAALLSFVAAVGLKTPWIVKSGRGLHIYFTFTEDVDADRWRETAAAFAAAVEQHKVACDPSRTQDAASILRIPGTHNYKEDPPQDVKIVQVGEPDSYDRVHQILIDATGDLSLPRPAVVSKATNELVGNEEYPPSYAEEIVKHCNVLRHLHDTGGDASHDVWWAALGVLKFAEDGDEYADKITCRRKESGHDQDDWRRQQQSWQTGPATCAIFQRSADGKSLCEGCKHNGNITSPIILGRKDDAPVGAHVAQRAIDGVAVGKWEFGAEWIKELVAKKHKIGVINGRLVAVSVVDDVKKHIPLCDRYWQVMRRLRNPDNVWELEIGYQDYAHVGYRTFRIPSSIVTSPDLVRKEFSARELHFHGSVGTQKAMQKLSYEQELLFAMGEELTVYPTMGWVHENNAPTGALTGEFVLGGTVFRPRQPPENVELASNMPDEFRYGFRTSGQPAEWVALVDKIYNRPRAEPYQFVIMAMFASPLVALMPGGGEWHGIPVALTGDSGAAKTTTALVGLSIYGPPQLLRFNANMDHKHGGQGDTVNAFALKVGMLQNIPFLADEMTNVEPEKLSAIMYMLANGRSKDRMTPSGQLVPNQHRWKVISIATGNEQFHSKLEQLNNKFTQEAAAMRCFEIEMKAEDIQTIFFNVTRLDLEHQLLAKQYGTVGRSWLQYVVDHREQIEEALAAARAHITIDIVNDQSAYRFYKDLIATVSVAGMFAKRAGFIKWNVENVVEWARRAARGRAKAALERDWPSLISDFISSLRGRTIVTNYLTDFGMPNEKDVVIEAPLATASVVARIALKDKKFVVTESAVKAWARENSVTAHSLLTNMAAHGYIKGDLVTRSLSLGKGTTIPRPPAKCYTLNYEKCMSEISSYVITNPNVQIAEGGSNT